MLGYKVTLAHGAEEVVEATEYSVDDAGALIVSIDGTEVRSYPAMDWIEVHPLGVRLSSVWPPANLDLIIDALRYEACFKWGDYWPPKPPTFESPLLNELDAFVDAVLGAVVVDPTASYYKERRRRLKDLVRRVFGLRSH